MSKTKLLLLVLAILCGIFFIIYGGYDDSPGGQGIGLLVVIIGIVSIVRNKRKTPNTKV